MRFGDSVHSKNLSTLVITAALVLLAACDDISPPIGFITMHGFFGIVRDSQGAPLSNVQVRSAYGASCGQASTGGSTVQTALDGTYRADAVSSRAPELVCVRLIFTPPAPSALETLTVDKELIWLEYRRDSTRVDVVIGRKP
jgi:hypothetical protein